MADLVKLWAKWKQFSTFKDWQRGPSLVHVHIVHGDTRLASPVWIVVPPTLQATRSFHNSRLISGRALQGTLGFKNGSGMSNMARWTLVTWSQLSQITFESVILRISASCASVNRIRGLPFSYQNRSHFRRFRNWIPIMQAKVGPTRPPWRGVSARPPEKGKIDILNILVQKIFLISSERYFFEQIWNSCQLTLTMRSNICS